MSDHSPFIVGCEYSDNGVQARFDCLHIQRNHHVNEVKVGIQCGHINGNNSGNEIQVGIDFWTYQGKSFCQ